MFKKLSKLFTLVCCTLLSHSFAQLPLVRDTITVMESGYVLKMPWAGGINYANVSSTDLNMDGQKDLVIFDRYNLYSQGTFRCFIKQPGSVPTFYRSDAIPGYFFPKANSWAVLQDYDNDGREDLFCAGNNLVQVYRNVSTAPFTPSFTLVKSKLITNLNPGGTPIPAGLFVSVVGVPGISDVDGDGDLDILSFSSQGTYLELNKNMSKEKYGHADSLVFDYASTCWGNISESNCQVDFNLCHDNAVVATLSGSPGHSGHKELHAGSCLTCIDNDGDGDKDLLMGDISCTYIQYAHNNGTPTVPSFNDTTKIYPNYQNNNTVPIRISTFPCAYVLDVDGDNKKDLLASPNVNNSENYRSLWYYHNTSTTNTVNFQFVKKNFLQDEMIEVGQNAFPALIDYDNDGKKDLLIGNFGYYNNNSLNPRLTLYRNTGTSAQPVFSLVSRDFGSLSSQPNLSCAMPAVGDIDGDGDVDICIGTSSGQVHLLENTGGAGNPGVFSTFHNNPFSFTTSVAVAAPQLFDLNGDGKLDLLIGMKNGRISYYQNNGTATAPSFTFITDTLGGVHTLGNLNVFGYDGYAVPFFYRENGTTKLLVGSVNGNIFHYTVPSNVLATYNLINNTVNNYYEGGQTTVWYEDVNDDGKRDLFIGNASGGLSFFTSKSPLVGLSEISPDALEEAVAIFPNPAEDRLNLKISSLEVNACTVEFFDLTGRRLLRQEVIANSSDFDISALSPGVYFIKVNILANGQKVDITRKLVKQ